MQATVPSVDPPPQQKSIAEPAPTYGGGAILLCLSISAFGILLTCLALCLVQTMKGGVP